MSTYRGYLSGLSIMQGIAGKRVHNQGTTQHFVSTVMGTLYFTLEVTADGVANPTASSVEISVDKVEGEDVVPKNLKDWLKNQEKDTTDP